MRKLFRTFTVLFLCLTVSIGFMGSNLTVTGETSNPFENYKFTEVLGFDNVSDESGLISISNTNYFDYSVASARGYNGTSAFCQTHTTKSPNSSYDKIEINLSGDASSVSDWSGASELWFYIDASQYCANDFKMFLGIKENIGNSETVQFGIEKDSCILFQNGTGWDIKKCEGEGYFTVSAGFKGFVRIMLNEASLYNVSGGEKYAPLLTDVSSISVAAYGDDSSLGKSLYIDSFAAVGKINGGALPVSLSAAEAPKFNLTDTNIEVNKNNSSDILDLSIGSVSDYNRYYISSAPQHGTVNISSYSGMTVYTPDTDYSGTDNIKISAFSDNFVTSDITIYIVVKNETKSDTITDITPTTPEYSGTKPDDKTLAVPEEKRATSEITDMGLEGYVGENLQGDIDNWLTEVREKDPQIIDQISEASVDGIIDISAIMSDENTMISNGVYSFGVKEYSDNLGRALIWNHLSASSEYREMYIKFAGDKTSTIDWTGAEQFWVYVDVSEYGTDNVPVGLGFQENNLNADGSISNKIERWGLKTGSKVYIYNTETASGWQEAAIANSTTWNGANKGRVTLPAGFKGWVRSDLTTDNFSIYYTSGATTKGTIDKKSVNQYQMVIEGTNTSVGKSAYVASFGVAGNIVGGSALPVAINGSNYSFKETWSIDAVSTTTNKKDSAEIWPWYGEFAGKVLTGMAYMYKAVPDSKLYTAAKEFADALIAAQKPDGYIGIYSGIGLMGGEGSNWDVWNHYHAIYGLYSWYQVSGDKDALNAAVKAADYVYNYFVGQDKSFSSAGSPAMNLAISHAFAILYKETNDEKYLNAAKQIVVEEWPSNGNWMEGVLSGLEYYQTSPRWEALHTIMTLGTLYEVTGDTKFYTALEDIWWSVTKTDRHNHGGFSTNEQASGSPFATGSIETCCTVAYMALGTEYLQLSQNSLVADELELSFFNCMLGALMQDDREVTYNTPMDGIRKTSVSILGSIISTGSPDFTCCQANSARGLAQVSQWAVITNEESLYVNYYGQSAIKTKTPSSSGVTITEDTVYPQNGFVKITLSDLSAPEKFKLCVRIPSWSTQTSVKVNGEEQSGVKSGSYFVIDREWKNSDTIEISLDMAIHYWLGEEAYANKTSVYYGPILMALDSNFSCYDQLSNITLQTTDLEQNLVVSDGSKYGCWLVFDTYTVDNKPIRLVDFASAGQNGQEYVSWLNVNNNLNFKFFVKGGDPVWDNSSQVKYTYGDVNNDGSVTASDALLALQSSVNKITLDKTQLKAADVDNKTGVSASDALLILQRSVGKISSFPIE